MKQEKQFLLDEIKGHIDRYQSFLITKNNGINSESANDLRTKIAALGGEIEMVRKRLLIKALEDSGLKFTPRDLPGQIGIVLSGNDYITITKEIYKYIEESDNQIEVIGAKFDGNYYESDDVKKLSKLPSLDQMRGQLLGLFEAPMAQMLAVTNALLTAVPHCLENKSKESEE
ncbi:MAG: 50S ribosomal protein L10 [Waddliaceae bacterium]